MTIDKIPSMGQKLYGVSKNFSKVSNEKNVQQGDSIKISSSAQDRFNEKKVEQVKLRLEQNLVNGVIDSQVLESISEKIASELGYLSNSAGSELPPNT